MQRAASTEAAPQSAPARAADSGGAAKAAGPTILADAGRKLVKTVDLDLRVKDTTASADRLRDIAGRLGGFVSGLSAQRRDDLLYYSITLRVPVDRLEEALSQVKGIADRVERESIRTEDVTERWIDLDARLVTLRATENELRQLLTEARQRGQKVEDIMAVYEKLTEIRGSIEQLEGEQKALAGMTSLSTMNVQLAPTEAARPIADERWSPGTTLRQSFRALLHGLQTLADLLIVVVVVALPMLLLVVLPLWGIAHLWRRWRRRRAEGLG